MTKMEPEQRDAVGHAAPDVARAPADRDASETAAPAAPRRNEKIKLREVNTYLTCLLCKGYLIDATTISECLHSFCRSCIIRFLQDNSHCPECEVVINKTKPNLKLDKTLQDIVYKLVPELYLNEMTRRRQFYRGRPAAPTAHLSPEQRGDDTERILFNARDKFSLCLEYISDDSTPGAILLPHNADRSLDVANIINNNTIDASTAAKEKDGEKEAENNMRRYLQCPGMCRIDVLKKFVRNKYNVDTNNYYIDVLYKRVPLPDHYTLIDIAYIYSWKRNEPMKFFFRITDIQQQRERFDYYEKDAPIIVQPRPATPTPVQTIASAATKDSSAIANVPKSECAEARVKKVKSVRFHSDVMKPPVATSTPIKVKPDKSDKHGAHGGDKGERREHKAAEKAPNGGAASARPQSPHAKTREAKDAPTIDVNGDEWLKKQVKRAAKELKKSKGKEVKNAIKDIQETIKDIQSAIKDISENGGVGKANGHKKAVMILSDAKAKQHGGGAKKILKSCLKTSPKMDVSGANHVVRSANKSPPLADESDLNKTAAMAAVDKEQFLMLMNLRASGGESRNVNQRKTSPSRKVEAPKSPKAAAQAAQGAQGAQGQKRKGSPLPDLGLVKTKPSSSSPDVKEAKRAKLSAKPKTPKVPKAVKTPRTPKVPKPARVPLAGPPLMPPGMSMSMTAMPPMSVKLPMPKFPAVVKPASAGAQRSVNLEEPNLKNLLNTCKIPSSLSITCVNGGTADREQPQIKPVINHIEILKLPEVREVASPDSTGDASAKPARPASDDGKACSSNSKEKLEKVGTTMKLQSKQECLKKEEVKESTSCKDKSELSITITVEKEADRKESGAKPEAKTVDDGKATVSSSSGASASMSSPVAGGHPGMGVHLNLPKILQPTPTPRNINSFQKMFEETVKKRIDSASPKQDEAAKTKSNGTTETNKTEEKNGNKRNILEIASQLISKKSKLEQESKEQDALLTNAQGKVAIPRLKKPEKACDTLSNLHSNKLALNYSVSINQNPISPSENVVTSTTTSKVDAPPVTPKSKPATPRCKNKSPQPRPCDVMLPKPIAPKGHGRQSPSTSPKMGIPMPSLSPLPLPPTASPKPHSPREKPAQSPKLDVNQLQEKYNLQNLAQLSASFNFPGPFGPHQPHQAMAALQHAMRWNFSRMQQTRLHMAAPANMEQYQKFMQTLSASQSKSPAQNILSKEN